MWAKRRRLFWTLHSMWALSAGTAVVIVARERYHFVLWVVAFLALAWASTLYFGRRAALKRKDAPFTLADEITSYIARVMYQETLFFLLPFYAYSTVIGSLNMAFVVVLGALAIFSCIDLAFDHWLRTRPIFGLLFFAVVAFAALNLLLPLLFGLRLPLATPVAALVSLAAAVPLARRTTSGARIGAIKLAIATAGFLVVTIGVPQLVPPVPLRLQSATFASSVDRQTLAVTDTLRSPASSAAVGASLALIVQVFAPSALPATVELDWRRDGETVHVSREVEIVARASGFRVWDAWRPADGVVPPGSYKVVLRTENDRVFGVAKLTVTAN